MKHVKTHGTWYKFTFVFCCLNVTLNLGSIRLGRESRLQQFKLSISQNRK